MSFCNKAAWSEQPSCSVELEAQVVPSTADIVKSSREIPASLAMAETKLRSRLLA
jgi:hypothetical protein